MQSIGGRKALALAVSSLAAIALLAIAGWMLLGGSDQPTAAAVQIIPPPAADSVGGEKAAAADLPNAGAAATSPAGSKTDAAARASPASSSPPAEIAVYVTGAVAKPGVYKMRQGQRLADALELAGGPTNDAALHQINLAAYLADAAHYRIPTIGNANTPAAVSPPSGSIPPSAAGNPPAGPAGAAFNPIAGANPAAATIFDPVAGANPAAAGAVFNPVAGANAAASVTSPAAAGCATPVDINTATADCLQTLPGIGRVRAESIVAHRQQAGPFAAAESITEVSGIGSGIYGQIANLITAHPR